MKRIGTLMACGALALAFSACDNGRTGDPDGGPIVLRDTGADDPDSGVIVMVDAGTDAGGPRACEMDLDAFPTALFPRCAAATRTCITDCGTDAACANACVTADTTPGEMVGSQTVNCQVCLGYAQAFCIQENGGNDLLDAMNCCAQDNGCTSDACVMSMCPSEFGAVYSGANPAASTCLSTLTGGPYAPCFATE